MKKSFSSYTQLGKFRIFITYIDLGIQKYTIMISVNYCTVDAQSSRPEDLKCGNTDGAFISTMLFSRQGNIIGRAEEKDAI